MNIEIKVPTMGESVTEAIISNLIQPTGSIVAADQEIIELETDKVNQVLYAPSAGALTWNVAVGDKVTIGQVIGTLNTDAKAPAAAAPQPKTAAPAPAPTAAPATPAPAASAVEGPSARKMAPEFVAELKAPAPAVRPNGPPSPAPKITLPEGTATRKKMSNLRKVIAQKLVEAKNSTAMLTTFNEIDMSVIMEIRAKEKESFEKKFNVRLGFMSFFVKGVVAALKAIPQVNAIIDGEDILTYNTYDIGVAVSTEKGLMVPVVRNCDQLSYAQVESEIAGFAKKARDGKITVDDLRGGSFTITNGGGFGSLLSTPILNIPQSAILGMHTIQKRAVVINDQIVIRPMMYVALSYDHRIIDGREAVLFLVNLKQNLEDPARLLLEL
jgi:2-oxoglutarate dehydrogenase E2 component (dihydrolipoamide succinyltransferase)